MNKRAEEKWDSDTEDDYVNSESEGMGKPLLDQSQ